MLAEELAAARKGEIAGALARYESRLRPNVEGTQRAGRRFAKWFIPDTDPGSTSTLTNVARRPDKGAQDAPQ